MKWFVILAGRARAANPNPGGMKGPVSGGRGRALAGPPQLGTFFSFRIQVHWNIKSWIIRFEGDILAGRGRPPPQHQEETAEEW